MAFILSIEPIHGKTYQHTLDIETAAEVRDMAEAIYETGEVVSVAIKRKGTIIDVFSGLWECMGAAAARFHSEIVASGAEASTFNTYWDDDLLDADFDTV